MNLRNQTLTIGDVFTPIDWCHFAAEKFGVFDAWIAGATVFDPTMGEGNLLESLVLLGLSKGFDLKDLPLENLFGNELNSAYCIRARENFKNKFEMDMAVNFTNCDVFDLPLTSYDCIFGNPPWANFNNLPATYKNEIKEYFHEFELVKSGRDLLLGGSRIDIATLVIQKTLRDFLKPNGKAVFFLPLSIFMNDGANELFRTYQVGGDYFKLETIYDLENTNAFANVGTRYGVAAFVKGSETTFPVPYHSFDGAKWIAQLAAPFFHPTDPLSVHPVDDRDFMKQFKPITVSKACQPRQGLNTCGANKIFFFKKLKKLSKGVVLVEDQFKLPSEFVHPLITSKLFKGSDLPEKWVLIPHRSNGKPLEESEIAAHPDLEKYLKIHEEPLRNRKGTLINGLINRGYWWALLGVGSYSFAPYKVVWESYGKKTFQPKIIDTKWQVNQSLQAYMPAYNRKEAEQILAALENPLIEQYLLSLKMAGTMNWAQPGKIKKLLIFDADDKK